MPNRELARQDGSQPERGTGQRQDHRAAPPGHRVPGEAGGLEEDEREMFAANDVIPPSGEALRVAVTSRP